MLKDTPFIPISFNFALQNLKYEMKSNIMSKIYINQPWATLLCSGILNQMFLEKKPEKVPGVYAIYGKQYKDEGYFSIDAIRQLVNHSLLGNFTPIGLPIDRKVGEVEIVDCVPICNGKDKAYKCTLANQQIASYFDGEEILAPVELKLPRVCGEVLFIPIRENVSRKLEPGSVISLELTEEIEYAIYENTNVKFDILMFMSNEKRRFFSFEMEINDYKIYYLRRICLRLTDEYSI